MAGGAWILAGNYSSETGMASKPGLE